MGGTNVGSGYNTPFCIEPHLGKVSEDDIKSSNSEHWAVFNECVSRSYLPNDSRHVFPHAGFLAGYSGASSC
jgi:hypothetical protein